MQVLNSKSLFGVLERCSRYDGYHVMALMSNNDRAKEFIQAFIEKGAGIVHKVDTVRYTIEFKNNSWIKAVTQGSGAARGLKCHEIIYDDGIEKGIISGIFLEGYDGYMECVDYENESLTNFLDEFTIIK